MNTPNYPLLPTQDTDTGVLPSPTPITSAAITATSVEHEVLLMRSTINVFARNRIVFKYASALSEDYQGDFWAAWELSNGGWFLSPKTQGNYRVCVTGNYYQGVMTAEAFGITVCLFALGEIAWKTERDQDIDAYYALRDYALDHAEASAILRAID